MIRTVRHYLFSTLRGRLIVGVALVHAVMMSVFIADLTMRQRHAMLDHQVDAAEVMSHLLAVSAAEWIAADDVSGLQELVESQRRNPELLFAILADTDGRVLAATDKSRVGQYLVDLPDTAGQTVLTATPGLVDVATSATLGSHVVGWARVGVGERSGARTLASIVRDGVAYTLAAIAVGSLIAWMMGRRLTSRLYVIESAINAIRGGARGARAVLDGDDEAALMAREFNSMLDASARQEEELARSHERLQAELAERTRLATAIDQAAETIVITDVEGTIQYVNPAFERVSGYSRAEAIGQNPRIVKSDRQAPEFYKAMWETLVRGDVWSGHLTNRTKDGVLYQEEAVISPIRNAEGVVTNYVSVNRNVTREMQLEEQYRQAQKMEAIGRLAGGIAHDFNNMLELVIGYADLALSDVDASHPAHESLVQIQNAGERSAKLTRQLLAFARKQAVTPQVLDLNRTVDGMLAMLRRVVGEDIEIDWKPDPGITAVKLDPSQLDQVLANLCVNARDAISGNGRIAIATGLAAFSAEYCSLHSGCMPGRFVTLAVTDDGCGIEEAHLGNIFEPFFTTKEAGKGTGLGLATVYGIVSQNGGFIQVDSAPGRGSTFTVHLPRHELPVAAGGPDPAPSPSSGGTETILVVEDEPAILQMMERMLASLGYHVLAAGSPSLALKLAAEFNGRISLLVTDIIMPEMNGRDLAACLGARLPELRTLFVSGYSGNVLAARDILEPEIRLLPKPFTMQMLARSVREVLDLPREDRSCIIRDNG